jgi:glycolate dehydrogenase FAD-binding subunit
LSSVSELETRIAGAPEGRHFAPRSPEEVAMLLAHATENRTPVRVWGGGTHQKWGNQPPEGFVLSTSHLDQVEHWEPDDLTIVVGAGIDVGVVENLLISRRQTAVLPERPGSSTVGGVLATGRSSLRRGRLLGTRERVLEITAVTGDGRIVRSGGRVVKNVSGYDIHRAMVGSFGSLGVIVSVCFKLWPVPSEAATIRVPSVAIVGGISRPLAVLESKDGVDLFVWGTPQEVESTAKRTNGAVRIGLDWPTDPKGQFRWSLRVPPAAMTEALGRIRAWDYLAIHGVGEIRLASESPDGASEIRAWAESIGGALVLIDHPDGEPPIDPWGQPPQTEEIQRRLIAQFDPARILNPNRLPGGM